MVQFREHVSPALGVAALAAVLVLYFASFAYRCVKCGSRMYGEALRSLFFYRPHDYALANLILRCPKCGASNLRVGVKEEPKV
ncbi:hypothetical protein [Altererythrobacter sp. Root672]|uniref:hypothetical protein n=1 Tax=Altererythrobacter sp. Root672 TaxID=1736584 RepID=UPI0006FB9678|nr:hypothetical protein [Altererythrobacter sp. Root672]KRA80480.1 hypothetical protein ASD76_15045 [Altererythrobacter sp. Root672]